MNPSVYILKLDNNQYYIGSTSDLERRLKEHRLGKKSGIKFSKSIVLVFSQEFATISLARKMEYRLKKFKNRRIIEKIIMEGKIRVGIKNKL